MSSLEDLSGLQSAKSTLRLEQIARLRARGVGEHVDLPQLVVCGDQSAGKSSILEGITGLPFPRQDGVCTKFPTEIILRHSDGERVILATILPTASRTEQAKKDLQSYKRHLESFDELPNLIAAAGSLMGLRGFEGVEEGSAFTQDVLRIEVTGPVGLHLTVVDLPGLISVASEEQTDLDVQSVQDMIDSYLTNGRTIILAVVQANNDIANQGIIQKSRRFDPAGERTTSNTAPSYSKDLLSSTPGKQVYGSHDGDRIDTGPGPSAGEDREDQWDPKEAEAGHKKDKKEETEGNGERDDGDTLLLLRSTKKRPLSSAKEKCRVKRRVKRHRFSSPFLSGEDIATGDESDISSYISSRPHRPTRPRPTSSDSTGFEGDTCDDGQMEAVGERSRMTVI